MTDQSIGHYDMLVAKRQALVRGMSPAAMHAHFPKIYPRPEPLPTEAAKLKEELLRVNKSLAAAKLEIASQEQVIEELKAQLALRPAASDLRLLSKTNEPRDVIEAYLGHLNEIGWTAGTFTEAMLVSPRRAKGYSAPRHVCAWLLKELSAHLSLPMIAQVLHWSDHTTVLHALNRAPRHIGKFPALKAASERTLAQFGSAGEP